MKNLNYAAFWVVAICIATAIGLAAKYILVFFSLDPQLAAFTGGMITGLIIANTEII